MAQQCPHHTTRAHRRRFRLVHYPIPLVAARWHILVVLLTVGATLPGARAGTQLSAIALVPSLTSGQPVGTTITWSASITGTSLRTPLYRFQVALVGGPASVLRDFSPAATVTWTPLREGSYDVQVIVEDGFTATSTLTAIVPFTIRSRVSGNAVVISPTANPLVALFSAPPCAHGQLVVQFRPATSTAWQSTASQPCQPGTSLNILVAGLYPTTTYLLRDVVSGAAGSTVSAAQRWTTGALPTALTFPRLRVAQPATAQADLHAPILFQMLSPYSPTIANPFATDLSGHLIWYYNPLQAGLASVWPVRIEPGGTVLLLGQENPLGGYDVFRAVDLAGDVLRETNVGAINAQLIARGQERIYGFHHDALDLPNGDTALLGYIERTLNGREIVGDMLIVVNPAFQVVWTWDAFDHLPYRPPVLGETCDYGECAAVPNYPTAVDWLHSNAIGWSPADRDLTLSLRDQDWVIKIAYANGHGDGHVVWRLGTGGDFRIRSTDPAPWFSHQHDAQYLDATTLAVFDDGNTRCQGRKASCDSRGQVYTLDEAHHAATLVVNADLGNYSELLGSAERLDNGDFVFTSGEHYPAQSIEVRPNGRTVYIQEVVSAQWVYRAYRMSDLDSGTNPG